MQEYVPYVPYEVPVARERERSPKNKQVVIDENDGTTAGGEVHDWRQVFFTASGSGTSRTSLLCFI